MSTTVANNTAAGRGSGVYHRSAELRFFNSILASTTGMACRTEPFLPSVALRTLGTNLDSDDSCRLDFSDLRGVDPQLGPLADNGGPTQTHALQPASLAIDFAFQCRESGSSPLTVDQRGEPRPQGPFCDIGAFEAEAQPDSDGDGVRDGLDNCVADANPDQSDIDRDGAGDACDPDDDGDGVADGADNCPFASNVPLHRTRTRQTQTAMASATRATRTETATASRTATISARRPISARPWCWMRMTPASRTPCWQTAAPSST